MFWNSLDHILIILEKMCFKTHLTEQNCICFEVSTKWWRYISLWISLTSSVHVGQLAAAFGGEFYKFHVTFMAFNVTIYPIHPTANIAYRSNPEESISDFIVTRLLLFVLFMTPSKWFNILPTEPARSHGWEGGVNWTLTYWIMSECSFKHLLQQSFQKLPGLNHSIFCEKKTNTLLWL